MWALASNNPGKIIRPEDVSALGSRLEGPKGPKESCLSRSLSVRLDVPYETEPLL